MISSRTFIALLFIAALCLASAFAACASLGNPARYQGSILRGDTSTAAVTLERGPCFGSCPEYTVAVYDDGAVIFNGIRHCRETGLRRVHVDGAVVRHLVIFVDSVSRMVVDERGAIGEGAIIVSCRTAGRRVTVHCDQLPEIGFGVMEEILGTTGTDRFARHDGAAR